jgi:hypothetical protein
VGNPGKGCSSDPTRQFNTGAFAGPLPGSLGLESGADYLRGCFNSVLDLSIVRNIRLGESRNFQFRLDMFNAPNASAVTGRQTQVNLASPTDPTNITNLPYNPDGSPIASRLLPKTAGFGVATTYQAARTLQAQIRISF